jgi:hypothetical protein
VIGTAVVAGRTAVISSCRLIEGKIRVVCAPIQGPFRADEEVRLSIFGEDGQGVLQSCLFPGKNVGANESVVFTYDMTCVAVN